jgi:hypothetical protein
MRRTASLILLLSATTLLAQGKIEVEGGTADDSGATRLAYFGDKAAVGQFAINYGRPAWKAAYDAPGAFDKMTKGKVWRMGMNFWTTFYTDLPLSISGTTVAPGLYFLGVDRTQDGTWSLAFIDPAKTRAAHVDAFYMDQVKVEFKAPLHEEAPQKDAVEKLTVTIDHGADIKKATLKIAWGHLALTAPVAVTLG